MLVLKNDKKRKPDNRCLYTQDVFLSVNLSGGILCNRTRSGIMAPSIFLSHYTILLCLTGIRGRVKTLLLKLFLFFFFFSFERGLSTTYNPLINKTTSHLTTLATREAEAMTWFKFPVSLVEGGKGERVVYE